MELLIARGSAASLFCPCILFVMFVGCGSDDGRATVRGSGSVDGVPLDAGVIALVPEPGSSGLAAGGVIESGSYSIASDGPLPGKYMVQITASRKTGQMVEVPTIGPGSQPGTMVEQTEQYIPAKYNKNTELIVEIESGSNRCDFELSSAG